MKTNYFTNEIGYNTISSQRHGMSPKNFCLLLFFLFLIGGTTNVFAQAASATWSLTSNASASITGAVSGTSFAKGSGVGTVSYGSNGASTTGWTTNSSFSGSDYYEVEIVPSAGAKLTVNSVSFSHSVSSGSTWNGVVYYSYDGFATAGTQLGAVFSPSISSANFTNSSTLAVPVGGTLSVRIYAYDSGSSTRAFRVKSVVISGTTCSMPVISTQPATQSICTGTPLNLSVTASNATSYQWKKGGSPIGGATSSTYSIPTPATTDSGSYTVDVINSCQTVTSATAVVTVNQTLASSVSISASATTICAGTNVTFTATPVNPGAASYQWKVNGANAGTNSTTFSSTTLPNNANVTCTMTSTTPCLTGLPAVSNTITMTVNPVLTASVSIATATSTICGGSNVTFTATPVNGGSSPSYQWKINGGNVGTNSPTFSSSTLADNNIVTCVMTSNASPCLAGSPATSNAITMDVYPILPASVSISASSTTICAGTNVTFTATPTNGGTASYQWKLNGGNVGTNSATYSNNSLANNDVVSCVMTSATPCLTGLPATSNSITMVVNPLIPASVSISATQTTVCAGTSVTFTATPTNGGTSPSYQWKINGSNTGTNSPTLTSSSLGDGNVITCVMTSNASPCLTGSPATSNAITMDVNPMPTAVSITPGSSAVCTNAIITLTATGGNVAGPALVNDNFNGTPTFTGAGSSNGGNAFAQKSSGNSAGLTPITTPDASKFMMAVATSFGSATTTSTLTSPTINSTGYTSLSLTYNHSYAKGENAGDFAKVEVSTDGSTWITVQSHTTNRGANNSFVNETVVLDSYINQTNLKIRFSYLANVSFATSWWAINSVALNGNKPQITWAPSTGLFTDAAATIAYTGETTSTIYAMIGSPMTYTATANSPAGCNVDSAAVNLSVLPLPMLSSVTQNAAVCENSNAAINLTGMLAGSTSTVSYTINNGSTQTATGVVADGLGNAAFAVPVSLTNNGQVLKITNIQRTDNAPSCGFAPSSNNTVVLAVNQNVTYYTDADSDGFGNPTSTTVSCFGAPAGYVSDNTDCNDAQLQYADNDGDGFGFGAMVACGVSNNTDCDDSLLLYSDADGDGFGAMPFVACGGLTSNTDCNDNQLQYLDADADGFGSATLVACGVSNSSDCDDNLVLYVDSDGDGFGSLIKVSCGGVTNNTDCNDSQLNYSDADGDGFGALPYLNCGGVTNNSDCNDAAILYLDADGDGFGSLTTAPCGVADNSDCNDSNALVHTTFAFFADQDLDGVGAGDLVGGVCAADALSPPAGYAMTDTDCDDLNGAIYQSNVLFVDNDNDGYTSGATESVCYGASIPSGYAAANIGIDCNDNVAAINPGHAEVLYNGVDDNCDGQLDEGFQITTTVQPSQCGTTLNQMNSLISAVSTPGATGYRFEVTNTTTNAVQTLVRGVQYFSLNMLSSYDYATTYSIRVELQKNGIWLGYYGAPCLVSSPAVLAPGGAAQVSPSQCGITLPSISTLISTTSLAGVSSYRFRVTNVTDATAPNQVQIIDRPLQWFNMTMLTTYNYGTTYLIEVAVKTNGVYSNFGSPCAITTPAVPSITNCGATITTPATFVYTTSLAKVTSYRFELTNLITNQVITIDRAVHYFTFNNIPGFAPSTAYGVRVAVMSSGVYSTFSDACEITSPGFARPEGPKAGTIATEFTAVAYPNPFAESFAINVKTSMESPINVKVYEMTG